MHATTKPLSASSPAPPGKWASRLLTESETTLGRQELVNEFDAAQFEALGPWITGFELGGNHYGGQYRADTDSRVLRFITRFSEDAVIGGLLRLVATRNAPAHRDC